jgi:hypothetical protein
MKKYFIVSLVKNGVLGGGILADTEAITYRTNKLTVAKEYRNIEMKYSEIESASFGWLLIFPTVTIKMKNGTEYKFIVFGRKGFSNTLSEMGVKVD